MIRRQNLILTSSAILAAGLWEASLEWTDLRGARMVPTDLRQADLRGADRQGADFRDAMLADATLQGVECNGATRFPESFGAGTAGAEFVSGKV